MAKRALGDDESAAFNAGGPTSTTRLAGVPDPFLEKTSAIIIRRNTVLPTLAYVRVDSRIQQTDLKIPTGRFLFHSAKKDVRMNTVRLDHFPSGVLVYFPSGASKNRGANLSIDRGGST